MHGPIFGGAAFANLPFLMNRTQVDGLDGFTAIEQPGPAMASERRRVVF